MGSVLITIGLFILVFGVVVFIHELGHFLAAKISDMKVEEFALGMGPKLVGKKFGETEYMLKLFPIGGYVKILGEEEEVKDPRSFSEKSVPARMLVACGGVIMNFLLAIAVFYVVLFMLDFKYEAMPYYEDFNVVVGEQNVKYVLDEPVIVLEVAEGSPAEASGLEAPVAILQVNGVDVMGNDELVEQLRANAGEIVELTLESEEGQRYSHLVEVGEDGTIGVSLQYNMKIIEIEYPPSTRVFAGVFHALNMTKANFFLLGKMFEKSIKEKTVAPVAESVTGPIGLVAIIDSAWKFAGLLGVLDLLGLFSLILGLMNFLPFPALDGGHMVLLTIEGVRGKPVNKTVQQWLFGVGMLMMFGLMIVITAKDFFQFGVWDWVKGLFGA